MPVTQFQTLSRSEYSPFNTALEDFFDNYDIFEDVECYQLFFCPYGNGTSFDDLYKLKFNSSVVILNVIDSIIDKNESLAIDELKKFFLKFSTINFILLTPMLGFDKLINQKNVYATTILSLTYKQKFLPVEKTNIKTKWLVLNSAPKEHRIFCISYLLSKKYFKNGYISYDNLYDYSLDINNLKEKFKNNLKKGYRRFKKNQFNRLNIQPYRDNNNVKNFTLNLLPIYEKISVELVLGTTCYQPVPLISEKEIQSFYGKNFTIFINSKNTVDKIKNTFNLDVFEDIVDHSYDKIDDNLVRIQKAIDRNKHLLNGSLNLNELWHDNRSRFNENCKKMDSMLFNKSFQLLFNEDILKIALDYFNIPYKRK